VSTDLSMLDLFRLEAEGQGQALVSGLLGLEHDHAAAEHLESCMRAAHSLKGAARIIGLTAGVEIAHALEDCFVAAQAGRIVLGQTQIDRLLEGVELLLRVAKSDEAEVDQWDGPRKPEIEACRAGLQQILDHTAAERVVAPRGEAPAAATAEPGDRVVRVTAESFNRLLGLASESLIKGRWVGPFTQSLDRLKRLHLETAANLDRVRDSLPSAIDERTRAALADAQRQLSECQQLLADRLVALDWFDRRAMNGLQQLYDEALACRMRPFRDGTEALPLLVRSVARPLGKRVALRIEGESTQVDRDLLGRLDAPLGHLLRNAIDHGIETPAERLAAGKPEEGTLSLEARHSAGRLHITLSDDGRGVDLERLRSRIVARKLLDAEAVRELSEAELLEFLFLPGFTLKDTVSDISGRGVGLDAVRDMVAQVRGTVRVTTTPGRGTQFRLQLPVTLSVLRALLVEADGEPYAFPLSAVTRALQLGPDRLDRLEGREHFELDGRRVGIVSGRQVFGLPEPSAVPPVRSVVVVGEGAHACGIVVDRFLGERELVVQPLDPVLGKIRDISAAALMDDGSPVLIVDVDDVLRSVSRLAGEGRIVAPEAILPQPSVPAGRKRILVVDDSLTVRELERKLLTKCGYEVEIAVDGMDGWNAVRASAFDLVITDVDMPRTDGIELVSLITSDPQLKSVPVMIVSYKDREDDRRRGLDAGASYYLAKGSFQDETLVQAVVDLIGGAES
jgi:two-component system sensor histidine kinase and response regulator WspE